MGRSAQLRLRGGDRPLGAQLVWPAAASTGIMVLLVDAGEPGATAHGEYVCRSLSETLGVVSLSASCRGHEDGALAIEWTADHAAQLGVSGAGLLLAGLHAGASVAAALAIEACDNGWPDVARQVLIHPRFNGSAPAPRAGMAPATVVGRDGRAYAAGLRRAGVAVDELDHPDPFLEPARPDASADRLLGRLAVTLSAA
jgi:alpha/beta hydrolase family protein